MFGANLKHLGTRTIAFTFKLPLLPFPTTCVSLIVKRDLQGIDSKSGLGNIA
jgi:hypothetical protein